MIFQQAPEQTEPGRLRVRAIVENRGIDVDVQIGGGEVLAVLGGNGAGKSTLLSLIAGLIRPDSGRITLDDRVLVDTADGTWVPAHRRSIALLAQQALLFPHMTALANVAFGPRSQGTGRRQAVAHAKRWLETVDATKLADRKPAQLSGGQAQRIAIARALAADPAVLLLDEPMSALDVAVAPSVRQVLRTVLRDTGRTAVLVTHDLIDALSLADRVIVMESGRIVEDGPARTVLSQPRSAFAARMAGVNLLAGVVDAHGVATPHGIRIHGLIDPSCVWGQQAVAVFRPAAVAVHLVPPAGSPRNHLAVTISELEPRGEIVRVHANAVISEQASTTTLLRSRANSSVVGLVADITAAATADLELVPGKRVIFAIKATEVSVYPVMDHHAREPISD